MVSDYDNNYGLIVIVCYSYITYELLLQQL